MFITAPNDHCKQIITVECDDIQFRVSLSLILERHNGSKLVEFMCTGVLN